MLVEVAVATGRSVAAVAEESFALTLWTWGELQEIKEQERVTRLGERVDMAGLMVYSFHDPNKLQTQELRYYREAGLLSSMIDEARKRGQATVDRVRRAEEKRSRAGGKG